MYQHVLVAVLAYASLSTGLLSTGLSLLIPPVQLTCLGKDCPAEEACARTQREYKHDSFESASWEWKLACEDEYKRMVLEAMVWIGMGMGAAGGACLSDLFGRRAVLLYSQALLCLSALISGLSPSPEVLYIGCFLGGFSLSSASLSSFTILSELVSSESRAWYTAMYFCGAGGGTGLGFLIAVFVGSWRVLALVIAGVLGVGVPVLWWADESPRYLAAVAGGYDAARAILQRIAKLNNKPPFQEIFEGEKVVGYQEQGSEVLPSSPKVAGTEVSALKLNFVNTSNGMITVTDPHASAAHRYSYPYLFTSIPIRHKLMLLSTIWVSLASSHHVILTTFPHFEDSLNAVNAVFGFAEVPIYLFAVYIAGKIGRKALIEWLLFFGGITCWVAEVSLLMEKPIALAVVLFLSKYSVQAVTLGIFLYTSELFPTCIRALSLGITLSFAAVSRLLTPYIVLMTTAAGIDPLLLVGTLMLASCLVGLDLQETGGGKLEDYLEEIDGRTSEEKGKATGENVAGKQNFEQFNEAA